LDDVLFAGAGPAGCIVAIVLARAGARVRLVDRAVFPRHKLCGDTLNPGALRVLGRLNLDVTRGSIPIDGMVVSGTRGARVAATYPPGVSGRAIARRDLDMALVTAASEAGAAIEEGILVQAPIVDAPAGTPGAPRVSGVVIRGRSGQECRMRSRLVIAADGRESRLARHVALARHPDRPRRWAVGAYFAGVLGMTRLGEMHVRPTHYVGVAPLPSGLVNACVVSADRVRLRDPAALLANAIGGEPELRDRFAAAEMVTRPLSLGPLAVDCPVPGVPGLLLAGDAAGFIDPMTGDGLRFALRGAELAASEGLRVLETGALDGHIRLAAARRREFQGKWRFNRAVRQLTGSPAAVSTASYATRLSGWPITRIIAFAGDLSAV
jgi:flavin-dependent dehydrogenase